MTKLSHNTQALSAGLLDFARISIRDKTDHLAVCFVELAARVEILCQQMEIEDAQSVHHAVAVGQTREISKLIQDLIIDIQSHDITDQRLSHVLSLLAEDQTLSDEALRQKLESTLTESGEREVAERLMAGVAPTVSLQFKDDPGSDIELF